MDQKRDENRQQMGNIKKVNGHKVNRKYIQINTHTHVQLQVISIEIDGKASQMQ